MAKIDWKIPLFQKLILIFMLLLILMLFASNFPTHAVFLAVVILGSLLIILQTFIILKDKS